MSSIEKKCWSCEYYLHDDQECIELDRSISNPFMSKCSNYILDHILDSNYHHYPCLLHIEHGGSCRTCRQEADERSYWDSEAWELYFKQQRSRSWKTEVAKDSLSYMLNNILKSEHPICTFCDNYDHTMHNHPRCKSCNNGKWKGYRKAKQIKIYPDGIDYCLIVVDGKSRGLSHFWWEGIPYLDEKYQQIWIKDHNWDQLGYPSGYKLMEEDLNK